MNRQNVNSFAMSLQDFEKILKTIYDNLEYDGYGYWMPEWCITEESEKPSFEDFVKTIKERT